MPREWDDTTRRVAKRLGENLRQARLRAGLSQGDLQRAGVIEKKNLSPYENGHSLPQIDTLLLLAAALGVPLSELLKGLDPREKS